MLPHLLEEKCNSSGKIGLFFNSSVTKISFLSIFVSKIFAVVIAVPEGESAFLL
jgi:hypothetical protein